MERGFVPFGAVTVFGGATVDRIAASSAPPVMGASNPGRTETTPGGVGLNVASVLARLGEPVRLVTAIGDDDDGRAVLRALAAAGIDGSAAVVLPGRRTATYQAALDDAGGLIVGVADMEIFSELTPAVVAGAIAAAPPGSLFVVDANLAEETLDTLVGAAGAIGVPVAALPVSPAKAAKLRPLLDRIALLFANRREANILIGREAGDRALPVAELAGELALRHSANVVVTDAEAPLAVAAEGRVRSYAPLRAELRSANGAGDALAAGTIHGLARGRGVFEAIFFGLAAAAITAESAGTLPAALTPDMIAERLGKGVATEPAA